MSRTSHVIRVSADVYEALSKRRKEFPSWDDCLRWALGVPFRRKKTRKFSPHRQPEEAWVLLEAGRTYPSQAKARGGAIMEAARTGREPEKPVRMREV